MTRRFSSPANIMRAEMWAGHAGQQRRKEYRHHHKQVCAGCGRKPSRHYELQLHHLEYEPAHLTGHEPDHSFRYLCVRTYGWFARLLHHLHLKGAASGCHRLVHRFHKWRWPRDAARPDQADYKKLRRATELLILALVWRRALRRVNKHDKTALLVLGVLTVALVVGR